MQPQTDSIHPRRTPRIPLAADRYALRQDLGSAGRVRTRMARDTVLDSEAIVRIATPALVAAAGGADRLRARLRALARIDHPHAVRITDLGVHEGMPFAVTAHVAGADLGAVLERAGERERPLDPEALIARLAPVAEALDAMHALGVVHGDVRPRSILCASSGATYLADAMAGSPAADAAQAVEPARAPYLSPEQVRGLPAGPASDQYALAVTIFEALAGRPPHTAVAPMAVAVERLSVEAPRLDALRGDLPATLADALARGLDREPAQRFASCAALVEAAAKALCGRDGAPVLMPLQQDHLPVARPVPAPQPRPTRRARPAARARAHHSPERKPERARRPAAGRRAPSSRRAAPVGRTPSRRPAPNGFDAGSLPSVLAAGTAGLAAVVLPWVSAGSLNARGTDGDLSGWFILALALAAGALAAAGKRLFGHIAAWGALAFIGYDAFRIIDQAAFEFIGWGLYVAAAAAITAVAATFGRRPL